jgi:hypothetical protein
MHKPWIIQEPTKDCPVVVAQCRDCSKGYEFSVSPEKYNAWIRGTNIQFAMPHLDRGQRELLISGMCSDCFDNLFRGLR